MGVSESWQEVEGLRVRLYQGGSGEPLILLHGGSMDSARLSWDRCLEPISKHFHVLAPDLPGYGGSDRPEIDYTIDFYTDFLKRFIRSLGLERLHLLGFSLGGQIALSVALRHPAHLGRLVLASCAGLGLARDWNILGKMASHFSGLHMRLRRETRSRRRLIRQALRFVVDDPKTISEELVDGIVSEASNPDFGRAWRSYLRQELDWQGFRSDFTGRLPEIQHRTLLIHGARDRLIPVRFAEEAQRKIPDSKLVILQHCGHWPPREKPGEFVEAVVKFLKS